MADELEKRAAKNAAWKTSIFADNKFSADLRRSNTVRDIFNEGYDAGVTDGKAAAVAALERETANQRRNR